MITVTLQFADVDSLIQHFVARTLPAGMAPEQINPTTTPPAAEPVAVEPPKRRGRPPKTESAQANVASNVASASPEPVVSADLATAGGAPPGDGTSSAPAVAVSAPAGAASKALTVDDAKAAGLKITEKFGAVEGMAKVRELCTEHGVKLIRDLKPEQIGAFVDSCKRVLA